jgi:hypothetical protein
VRGLPRKREQQRKTKTVIYHSISRDHSFRLQTDTLIQWLYYCYSCFGPGLL